jgi:hypothetical protein
MICKGAANYALQDVLRKRGQQQQAPLQLQLAQTERRCGFYICRRVTVRAEHLVRVDGQLRHAVEGRDMTVQDFEDLKQQLFTQVTLIPWLLLSKS